MIDIHHHLLWGLDDGASNLETSLAMARIAAADGITHVVCSPHANGRYAYQPQVIAEKIGELQQLLDREHLALKLGHGCDFHLSYDNIQEAKADPGRFSINGLGYLLVEIPDYGLPRGLTEIFYELQLVGLTPILTHPERNPTLQADRAAWWSGCRAVCSSRSRQAPFWAGWANRPNGWHMSFWLTDGSISLPRTPTTQRRAPHRCARRSSWSRRNTLRSMLACCASPILSPHSWASRCSSKWSRLHLYDELKERVGGSDS